MLPAADEAARLGSLGAPSEVADGLGEELFRKGRRGLKVTARGVANRLGLAPP